MQTKSVSTRTTRSVITIAAAIWGWLLTRSDGLDIVRVIVGLCAREHRAARDRDLFLYIFLAEWVQFLDTFVVVGVHNGGHIEVCQFLPALKGESSNADGLALA